MNTGLDRFGLSAATLATLGQIRGAQPATPPAAPAAAPPVDQDSPEAWAAAAAAAGAPGGVITDTSGSPNPLARSNPNSAPAIAAGVAPDNPAAAEAMARRKALEEATPQGPAEDTFPTVKGQGEYETSGPVQNPYGAAGAMRTVPAHWQPGSHSVTVQRGLDPEALRPAMEEHELSAQHGGAAADARQEAMLKMGEADALYAAGRQLAGEEAQRKIAQINRDRDFYVAGQQKKFQELNVRAQKEVDPEAYWKAKGTGVKIAAALAIGMNQFAVMWRGKGQNVALQMIEGAIDDNIKAQQANINNARAALDKEQDLYGRNLAIFGDRERATLATKDQYLSQVAAMADARRAEAKTPEAEAAYHDFYRQIYKERSDIAARFGQLTADHATETMNESFRPAQTVGIPGAGVKGKDDHFVPTLGGYARSKEDAAKLNMKGGLRMQIAENMRQIDALLEKSKSLSSTTDSMEIDKVDRQIASLVDDALTKNTVLEGQGAMSAADKEVAASAKGLSGLSVRWKLDKQLSARQEGIRKSATNMLTAHRLEGEAYGVQKGNEQYVQGPNGPVPVQKLEGRNAIVSKRTQGHDDLVQKPKGVDTKK